MEVTFLPGLENLGEHLLAKKRDEAARKGETVWDAYLRRKRCAGAEGAAQRLGGGLHSQRSVQPACLRAHPAAQLPPPGPPICSEKKAEAKRKGRRLGSDESDSDYDERPGSESGGWVG